MAVSDPVSDFGCRTKDSTLGEKEGFYDVSQAALHYNDRIYSDPLRELQKVKFKQDSTLFLILHTGYNMQHMYILCRKYMLPLFWHQRQKFFPLAPMRWNRMGNQQL